ncbi:polygalacturonase 1 beta-like protein 1 [Morus notabilis]|uniref:polygalacturonase 1 beta-like protein 1 n=1 Tax=Morus notabilis TaxID=981085 RepID=UPI000CED7014|nr:polygalacturonase 1 beta-like protein 1 [Morus notabilis]
MRSSLILLLSLFLPSLVLHLQASAGSESINKNKNPFTAKASLIRYWNKQISNNLPKPNFLLSKASPLGPTETAILIKLATQKNLSAHLESFCSLAHLFCSFDDSKNDVVSSKKDSNFATYANKNFANYGAARLGGGDSFKNYSAELNSPNDSFRKYSRGSNSHGEGFDNYAADANVATSTFTNYGADATAGSGEFKTYHRQVNVPNLRFSSYDSAANGHRLSFSSYAAETNSGAESFVSYSKNGNGVPSEFGSYGEGSNTVGSGFTGYGESGNGGNDTFKGYGLSGNNPKSDFKSYGSGGTAGIDQFWNYRNGANVGGDSFLSYARNSNSGKAIFVNYGKSFNLGNDSFKEYGKGATGRTTIGFKSYSLGRTFKDYTKNGVVFMEYNNFSTAESGNVVNRRVEEGKFFRESALKKGNVMAMPDIRDKMRKRSFLPRYLLTKLPFSKMRLDELKVIFHAQDGSAMERVIIDALDECERAPSPGETKRCVGSAEDMIDFAISVLGRDVAVRTTENVSGSKGEVMIGKVRGINGGNVTKSVSCHQSFFPYLLYYCHSVPKVRVYEADILDVKSKAKINHGIAICHLDTSSWAPSHGAFVALGSGPGKIEVCHWIFENDMTWTVADH